MKLLCNYIILEAKMQLMFHTKLLCIYTISDYIFHLIVFLYKELSSNVVNGDTRAAIYLSILFFFLKNMLVLWKVVLFRVF